MVGIFGQRGGMSASLKGKAKGNQVLFREVWETLKEDMEGGLAIVLLIFISVSELRWLRYCYHSNYKGSTPLKKGILYLIKLAGLPC